MESYLSVEQVMRWALPVEDWLYARVLLPGVIGQLAAILATGALAFYAARLLRPQLAHFLARVRMPNLARRLSTAEHEVLFPVLWLVLEGLFYAVAQAAGLPTRLLSITANLIVAWIIIRLFSGLVRNATLATLIAITAWVIAALNILGLLAPTAGFLDSLAYESGDIRISVLTVLKGLLTLGLLFWGAVAISNLVEKRMRSAESLTPSLQVLFSKLARIFLFTLAILFGISAIGIDITALAVFSGALGVGIGFGLQKPVSNFISGLILLMDRSIKPGDVIEVENGLSYGWINKLSGRHVSVITRDGKEHLIPNEELITQRVVNWSYSSTSVRIKTAIRVAYDSNPHKVRELVLEAVKGTPRVLEFPKPVCLLIEFGESALNFELRFWIDDPANGVHNVQSDVLLRVWDKFQEHGVKIPYPQRDVHIDLPDALVDRLGGGND